MTENLTLTELIQRYVEDRIDLKQNSIAQIVGTVSRFSRFLGHPATLSDLTKSDIVGLMKDIVEQGGSPVTANRKNVHLRTLWHFAEEEGLKGMPPRIRSMKVPERIPTAAIRQVTLRLHDHQIALMQSAY